MRLGGPFVRERAKPQLLILYRCYAMTMGRGHRKNRFGVSVVFGPDRYGGRATAANMALADGMGCMIPRSRLTTSPKASPAMTGEDIASVLKAHPSAAVASRSACEAPNGSRLWLLRLCRICGSWGASGRIGVADRALVN